MSIFSDKIPNRQKLRNRSRRVDFVINFSVSTFISLLILSFDFGALLKVSAASTCYMKYELFGNLSQHEKPVSVTHCRSLLSSGTSNGGGSLPDPELWNARTREILNSRPTRCYALWGHVHAQDADKRAKWHTSSHSIYGCLNAEQTTALNMYTRTADYPTEPGCYRYVSEASSIGYLFTLCVCDSDKCNEYGEEDMKNKYGVKGTKVMGDVLKFEMTFSDAESQELETEQREATYNALRTPASGDASSAATSKQQTPATTQQPSIKCKIKSMLGVGNQLDNNNWSEFACPPSTKYCVVRQGVAQAFDHSTIFDWRSNDSLPVSTRHCATPMRLARLKQLYNISFDTYPDNACISMNSSGPTTHFEGALCTCDKDNCNVNDTEIGKKLLAKFQATNLDALRSSTTPTAKVILNISTWIYGSVLLFLTAYLHGYNIEAQVA